METVLLKPRPLKKGERIGVIAPAGPVKQDEIQPGINLLKSYGHSVTMAPHLYDEKGYLAGEDRVRLEDLHTMFHDRDVKLIICARGGYGSLRIIDKVDFSLIQKNPKIFVGYSDITAILLAIYKQTGLVTFHGPVVRDLHKNNNKNLDSLMTVVSANEKLMVDLTGGRVLRPGKVKGRLLGGNLSLISSLVGTRFMPSLAGAILFLEEKGESLYRLDRMLTHLKLSGSLDLLGGLMVGRFEDCGDIPAIDRLLLDMVSGLDIPVISGLPVGHGRENMTLPLGLPLVLDTDMMTLTSSESSFIP